MLDGISSPSAQPPNLLAYGKLSGACHALAKAAIPLLAVAVVAMNAILSVGSALGQSAPANAPPVITSPGDESYEQGETITSFGIMVSDADGDTVTVTVTGLPSGLSYTSDQVQGTVAAGATAQAYTATISADDGVNAAVTETFTITVSEADQTPPADQTSPTVTISGPTAPQRGAFDVRIAFSEPVTGFEKADVAVGNGFVREFSGSGASYRAKIRITPGFSGTVTVDVGANVAADADDNGNTAASRFSVEGDQTRPTVTISGPTGLQTGPFDVTFTFTESMTGFEQGDLTVGNGSVTAFSGSGRSYTATIAPADAGTVTVDVAAHRATDATGNPNMPASRHSVQAEAASNAAPVITAPGDKTYEQGETITSFGITVTDADEDTVTVELSGLPSGLSYTSGQVQGTVAGDAAAQDHTVTISADDGVNAAVTETFTITVTKPARARQTVNSAPVITTPGDKSYEQGESITAFGITVTDADQDTVTVTLTGLPSGLSYASGQVQGIVAVNAAIQDHTVTVSADDGVNTAVTETFTITVEPHWNRPTVDITGPTTTQKGAFLVRIVFSEEVYGFTQGDVTVGNGSMTNFSGSYDTWSATITPAATGTVTVDVAENVVEDGVEYGNVAAPQYSVEADFDAPTVSISGPTASQSDSFDVTITFSESVTGFDKGDVTVGGGAAAALSGSGSSYTATITPTASGTLTVDVAAGVAVDGAGHSNTAASRFSVTVALAQPTVVISGPTSAQAGAFQVTITFSESVSGFAQADVTVGNGRVTGWAETNGNATVYITPAASGTVTVDVAENVATDGDNNGNLAAVQYSVQANLGEPTVTISCPTGVQTDTFGLSIKFSESVSGFARADVTVDNGRVTGWAETNGTASVYITPAASGTVTIGVPANVATDNDGYGNLAAQPCSVQADLDAPALTVADASASEGDQITFTVALDKAVSGGFTVTPGFAGGTATKGTDYTANTAGISFAGTAGETQTFTVATTEDAAVEAHETFTVSLSVSGTTEPMKATDPATGTIIDDDGTTSVTVTDASAGEGDSLTFTVTLNKAVSGGFTVTPSFSGGKAAKGTDYTANTAGISFTGTAGEQRTFTVATTEDEVVEYDETFTVSLAVSGTSETVTATDTATGTVTNDDFATVTVDDATGVETYTSLVPMAFSVRIDKGVQGGLLLKTVVTNGTATKDSDFRGIPIQLPFGGWPNESRDLSFNTVNDEIVEGTETFTVGFEVSGAPPGVTATDTGTVTITDDDGAAVTISDASAREGNAITFTATVDRAVVGGFTVTPSFTDGTAASGTDYTQNTAALTFAGNAGEQKTFTVATTADQQDTSSKTFTVGLSLTNTSLWVKATDTATGTILDTAAPEPSEPEGPNSPPVIGELDGIRAFQYQPLEPWTIPVSDADGDTLTLTLENLPPGLSYSDGAVRGTPLPDAPRIPAGQSKFWYVTIKADDGVAATVTRIFQYTVYWGAPEITVPGDKTYEQGEAIAPFAIQVTDPSSTTVTVTGLPTGLSYASGQVQGTVAADADVKAYTVKITADGRGYPAVTETFTITVTPPGAPKVTIEDVSADEGDSISFTVTLSRAVSGGLTVTPSFTDVTAAKGTDYTENTAALSFAGTAGEQQTFTVATTEDADIEADETFTVSLAVSGTSETVTASDTATGTITNDDAPALTIADASASEGESMTFTVTLDAAVSGQFLVDLSFTDGTATEGTDYTAYEEALEFAGTAGEQQTFTMVTTEDTDVEAHETFTVSLSVSGTQLAVTASDTARGTIIDDDGATAVTVADASAGEGDSLTFTVTLNKAVSGGLTVTPSFTDVTAAKGTDYTENTAALSFAGTAGEQQTFTVATTEDADIEADETFTVSLAVSGTSETVTASDTATGTITNDDAPALTIADASASEGESMTFTVTLDAAVSGQFLVDLSFTDGTATEGTDYTAYEEALEFAGTAGEQQTFTMATIEDTDVEVNETFTVSLRASGTSETITASDTATGTIIDDDGATAVTVADASAGEGDSLTFTVTLNKAVAGGFTVTPSFTDVTAAKGTDYTENTAALSFAGTAGEQQTFTVATTEDADVEADETFTVSLAVSAPTETITASDTATGTIINDDDPATVTIADASASEGDSMTFTVTLDSAVAVGFIVTPSFTDVTARSGVDYTQNTTAITFAGTAGETRTFTVATTEDAYQEADETFTVGLSVSGASLSVRATDTATGTILDDGDTTTNSPPVIKPLNIRHYDFQYQTILPWCIKVHDDDGDEVTVTVTGLPQGLSHSDSDSCSGGTVSGTVMPNTHRIPARRDNAFIVKINADDGVNAVVTHSFNYFVMWGRPHITSPGDKTYQQGEQIAAFDIVVDADEKYKEVELTGLPDSLSYESASEQVTGTVDANAEIKDYTVTITADGDGPGWLSPVTDTFTITVISSRPDVQVSGPADAQNGAFDVTITFTESVTGFEKGDVTVGNGTATALSGSGSSYTATITPTASGTVTVDVDENVAEDGASNGNTAASRYSVEADLDAPTVSITGPTASQSDSFDVTITFTESVTGFEQEEVTVGNGAATALTGSGASYTATITPTASGTLTVDVDENVAEDGAGNGNTAADQFTVPVDLTRPTVVISCPTVTQTGAFDVGIAFSESVTGFEQAEATVGNGTVTALTGSGASYTATITPAATGTLTVDVAENVAADGEGHGNLAAQRCRVQVNLDDPKLTIFDESASEGDSMTFTVTLDKDVSGGFTVTPSFIDVTATKGTDYTENTAALSFKGTAGEEQTFTVATIEDAANEPDETFTVGLSVSGTSLAVTDTEIATGTITDDDVLQRTGVTIADGIAAEGDSLTFTMTLNNAVSGGFTVTPSFTDVTATKGTDYTENTAALSFKGTAGEQQTLTVATIDDADPEPNEVLEMSLSVSGTTAKVTVEDVKGLIIDDDAPAVTVDDASAAEGDSITFTVTLDNAVSGGLTVTPSFTDGTATEGTDYTENTAALTFTGTADETQSFTVATTEDTGVESDETFTVSLTVSGTSETVRATDIARGTITNDDGEAALTIADASAEEGDSITFTVTLDKAVSGGLAVTPVFTDETATEGTDYTENTDALTFTGTAGEEQTFTVATTEDTEGESDETFTVSLTVSGTSATVASDTAIGTVTDDDHMGHSPAVVTVADASADEGDAITFTVTLDKAVSGGLTVTPSFTDGTATKGTDYTENTAAITFAGSTGETQTFTVATTEDTEGESDETFTVGLAVSGLSGPETVTATDTATGTIVDDELPALSIADASASEGDSLTFTVTLDKAVSGGLTVTPSFTDGTATKGTDYTENTAAVTFAGSTGETQTFTVATTEDADAELDETFTVDLTVTTTQTPVAATDTATGTITNDDGTVAAVTIEDASAAEGDQITFTVTLDKAVSGGLTVTPAFTDETATEGTDYTENTAALTFTGTAGETQTFTVATTEDTDAELDETFTVDLTVSGTQSPVAATDTATGTITNDDGAVPAVTIEDASAAEGDQITFTVTLDKAVSGGLTVTPAFTDETATEGTDYTENTTALTFTGTAGETQTFTVATTEDSDAENDETFTVNLTVSGTQATVTATDTATGTITNDDGALAAVTIGDASASEGDSLTFTVTLDKAVSGGLTVTPGFADGTAAEGTDYTENTAALGFTGTAGETQSFTVTTTEDRVVEEDETFTVSLNVSDTSTTVRATDTATGTITNDDGLPSRGTAVVTIASASAAEGESLTFRVTLNLAVQGGLTVTPSFTDDTATGGTDYTENTAALSFTGTTGEEQTITVATTEDAVVEEDETFTVSLSVSDAPSGVTVGDPATGTITDDDGGTTGNNATVTIANASAVEGDSLTFTVTLNRAVQGGLTVTPSFADGTAVADSDYTANVEALSFVGTLGETQTIVVETVEDAAAETEETFTVSLSVSNAPSGVTVGDPATGTISDDDGAEPAVTVADASTDEGDPMTFTVTLNQVVQGGLTVTPSFSDGTATESTDYTADPVPLSFTGTAGEQQTITVETVEDAVVEADETFTVSLAVSGASTTVTATDTATGTITDDDGGTTGGNATVTIANASAVEGNSLTFTVTLNQAVQGGLTVTPSFSDGTATESTDYTANPVPLSFTGTAGEQQTITVETVEDTVVEEDETFTVSLSVSNAPSGVTVGDPATGTISDDDGATGGTPTVTIANASAVEGDSLTFTVTLNQAVQGGLAVTPGFSDGTAVAGTDYTENTAALSFTGTAGEEQTFTVETIEDEVVEDDETFTVSLNVSNAPSGVTVGDPATGTISDDDGATGGTPTVTIADASAVEGDSLTFTVTLNQAVQGGLAVTPGFSDGTAVAGTDYTENTAALSFTGTAGEEQTFTVETIEDEVVEDDETFTVSLNVSNAPSGVTVGDPATGTISDDDGATGGTPTVTIANASAVEGDSLTFTVTLNQAVQGGLTVTPGFSDGTAVAGTDYTENTAALSFTGTAGEEQTFTVETIEDEVVEDDETFTVSLNVSNAPSGVTVGDPATGTISDDDGATGGTPTVTIANASAVEGDSLTFTVTLNQAVQGGLAVTPGFSDGTAVAGTDYTENTAALGFTGTAGEEQTFTVETIEDEVVEDDETFTVSLNVSNAPSGVTAGGPATGTITNDNGGDTGKNHAPVAVDDSITVLRGGTISLLSNEYKSAYAVNREEYPTGRTEEPPDDTNNDWDQLQSPQSNFFPQSSVLANDSDLEDGLDQLSVELITSPDHGHLTLNRDGTFTFVHDGSRGSHEDRFTYQVRDSHGASSNIATVKIMVISLNAGPEGEPIPDQVLTLGSDGTVDVASYFTDPDGDPLSYDARASDGSSTVEVNLSGSEVVLTPVAIASTRITVTARDPEGLSAEQSFGVMVESVQDRRSRLLELSLAVFGRTVASQAVDAIGGRFEVSSRESRANFGGRRLDVETAPDDQGRSRVAEWLQTAASLLGTESIASDSLTRTPAAGRPVPGQWDVAGRQAKTQTELSPGGGLSGGSGAGGFGAGSLPLATGRNGFNRLSSRNLMSNSSFQFAPDKDGSQGSNWMLWGQGVRSSLHGQPQPDMGLDGRVGAAYLGADRRWGAKALVGLAASHSVGVLDFANGGNGGNDLEVGARLTSALPYLKWSPRPGFDLWGLMGYGRGAAEVEVEGDSVEMGIDVRLAALGGRSDLTRLGAVDLALKADAFAVSVGSEAVGGLKAVNGHTQRARLMLEGRTDWTLSSNSRLTPSLEVGARMDGGDAETGIGAELAGGASFANRRLGLVVEARGHWLIAHQDRNFRERGARLTVRLDPGADGKGWGFSLAPLWGNTSGGADALWRSEQMPVGRNRTEEQTGVHLRPNRTQADLSYRLETWGGRGRLGPFAKMDLEGLDSPRLGGGLRLEVSGASKSISEMVADGLRLELFGDYRRRRPDPAAGLSVGPSGSPDYRIGISLVLNF